MKLRLPVLAVAAWIASVAVTSAADFYPIDSITSSTSADDLFAVGNLISGPGVGFDATEPHNQIITGGDVSLWVTNAYGFPRDYIEMDGTPVLLLDLGADVDLGSISTWGYSDGNANGVKEFKLRFATSAEGAAGLGTSVTYNPTFAMDFPTAPMQTNAFAEVVTARFVEFTATDNFFLAPGDGSTGGLPGGDRVGLGEIAFAVPVPEPTSLALLSIVAAGGLVALRRRVK